MSDRQIIASISLNEDEVLVKQKRKSRVATPNYYMVGNGTMNNHKIKAINFIKEMVQMSDSARYLINKIVEEMVWNPYEERVDFVVNVVTGSETEKKKVTRGFAELSEKDLVRRVKRGYYMINPNALITDYEKQIVVWDSLEKKNKAEE